jgi:hypothetical protein
MPDCACRVCRARDRDPAVNHTEITCVTGPGVGHLDWTVEVASLSSTLPRVSYRAPVLSSVHLLSPLPGPGYVAGRVVSLALVLLNQLCTAVGAMHTLRPCATALAGPCPVRNCGLQAGPAALGRDAHRRWRPARVSGRLVWAGEPVLGVQRHGHPGLVRRPEDCCHDPIVLDGGVPRGGARGPLLTAAGLAAAAEFASSHDVVAGMRLQ